MRSDDPRYETLERRIDALLRRIERLEGAVGVVPQAAPPPPPPGPPAPPPAAAPPPGPPPARRPPGPGILDRSLEFDLEDLLGGRVLAWLGAIAIVLGVGF